MSNAGVRLAMVIDRTRFRRHGIEKVLERSEVSRGLHSFRRARGLLLLRKPAQLAVHEPSEWTNERCEHAYFRDRHVFHNKNRNNVSQAEGYREPSQKTHLISNSSLGSA